MENVDIPASSESFFPLGLGIQNVAPIVSLHRRSGFRSENTGLWKVAMSQVACLIDFGICGSTDHHRLNILDVH